MKDKEEDFLNTYTQFTGMNAFRNVMAIHKGSDIPVEQHEECMAALKMYEKMANDELPLGLNERYTIKMQINDSTKEFMCFWSPKTQWVAHSIGVIH